MAVGFRGRGLPAIAAPAVDGVPNSTSGYAFHRHTLKGKQKGKRTADSFGEEQRALKPCQAGLFG